MWFQSNLYKFIIYIRGAVGYRRRFLWLTFDVLLDANYYHGCFCNAGPHTTGALPLDPHRGSGDGGEGLPLAPLSFTKIYLGLPPAFPALPLQE